MTHMHWIWWFYRSRKDNGDFDDVTAVDILADSYDEAISRVASLQPLELKGPVAGYSLRNIIEHLPGACGHSD